MIDFVKLLILGSILFFLGLSGILLNRKNIIIVSMSVELILLAVSLNVITFSLFIDDLVGQIFSLLILTVAAAESAIGLAILVIYYRINESINILFMNLLKG